MLTLHSVLNGLGWAGAIGTAVAYLLVSRRRMSATSLPFQGINAVGALFLATSAALNSAWASATVNLVWMTIGLAVIAQQTLAARTARRQADDAAQDGTAALALAA